MEKNRKRAQRRFDTWRVQRNRIRFEYECWGYAYDGPKLIWEKGWFVERKWVYDIYWTPKRMGRLRWGHCGCGCKMCKPWKWFTKWDDRKNWYDWEDDWDDHEKW
jgi:hypothetical protein